MLAFVYLSRWPAPLSSWPSLYISAAFVMCAMGRTASRQSVREKMMKAVCNLVWTVQSGQSC